MDRPTETRETEEVLLQYEYNSKCRGEPDNWVWIDAGIKLPQGDDTKAAGFAREHIAKQAPSNWTRGYRLIRRFTRIVDATLPDFVL